MPPLTLCVLVKDLLEDADAGLGPRLHAVAGNVVALAARPLTGLLVNPEPMRQCQLILYHPSLLFYIALIYVVYYQISPSCVFR